MATAVRARQTGGHRIRRILREAGKGGVSSLEVGFFASARYKDGTPVAAVAAWNEFGTKRDNETHIPERPFFRQANAAMQDEIVGVLKKGIDPKRGVVDRRLAGRVGLVAQKHVQRRIRELDEPENAESTVLAKGSSNPLIDEGFMHNSVAWRVNA